MRRLAITLVGLALGLLVVTAIAPDPVAAQTTTIAPTTVPTTVPTTSVPPVDVVELSGLLDPVTVDFASRAVDKAATDGAQALIFQMNMEGAVAPRDAIARLADKIAASKVLVAIWVGPAGGRVYGAAAQLLGVAQVTGMAPGARIGNLGDPLPVKTATIDLGPNAASLRTGTMTTNDARSRGVLKPGIDDRGTPTVGDLLVTLEGVQHGGTTLHTAEVVQDKDQLRRRPVTVPRFAKLELTPRLMHTVASPPVAYLLLTIGLALLVFEFFTAGVGVAGLVGAACLLLGCYGAAVLPTRPWAFGLLLVSMLAFSIDVQTGVPRFWTGAGFVLFVTASLVLYDGFSISWITLLVAIAGVMLTFIVGMPSMVRTRFATPTIGRDWMIGSLGSVVVAVDPDGVVEIEGAQWKARTNRATPLAAGDRARVVAIEGIVLEVEPEHGGARDHREPRRAEAAAPDA